MDNIAQMMYLPGKPKQETIPGFGPLSINMIVSIILISLINSLKINIFVEKIIFKH
jgi:hypothetical protein